MLLIISAGLDALFGEPRWIWQRLPHPVVLMGHLITALETRMNAGELRRLKGVACVAVLILAALIPAVLLSFLPFAVQCLAASTLIAQKSLVEHLTAVVRALGAGVPQGRSAVAMIVGRDCSALDAEGISRAAIESGAENLSDGVIAPLFWLAVTGLPGLVIYKIVNTADSIIGHKNARFERFGWAAARLDDLLNLVPARLSALAIISVTGAWTYIGKINREARTHRSPNAGWPEAAMAYGLGTALGGPRSYQGQSRPLPWLNEDGRRALDAADIDACVRVLWRAWALSVAGLFAVSLLV